MANTWQLTEARKKLRQVVDEAIHLGTADYQWCRGSAS
jgi:formate-dependent phosphoribosylglycinamide formyltransferase (GAR transformylase)